MSELSTLATAESHRFRASQDWFVVTRVQGVMCTRVGASAERTVDLMHALSAHLDPAVDMRIRDLRTARTWRGDLLGLQDVREAVGRLRLTLAAYGGVELSLFTADDQLTLTPELLLVIYSRTDRWAFLLDGMGLTERAEMPPRTWRVSRDVLRDEPPLLQALESAAERLSLEAVQP